MDQPPASAPPPPPAGEPAPAPQKGFIARIFDLSFSEFVTPSLIKVIFVIGIVGAGLMFAGIADTCGMGMLLAKMPWNQVSAGCSDNQCSA